jgi:DNA-binding FadR family transcriptional regulator
MPLQTIESQRLYRQIADQLSELIGSGEFVRGQRLPSERELASQLGVSRQSVREALIALEIAGKVEVRVGAGIYVAAPRPVVVADPESEGQGPFELLRARWLIEGEIAAEAAKNGSPEDLEAIRSTVDEMERCEGQKKNADTADRDFHLRIASAARNSALVSVVRDLWDRGRGAIWKRMELHFQTPELRAAALRDHRAIVATLEVKDGRGARAAMRQHLERVDREFSRGWELLKEHDAARRPDVAEDRTPSGRRTAPSRSPR